MKTTALKYLFFFFGLTCSAQDRSSGFGMEELDFSPFQTIYKTEVEICNTRRGENRSLACIQKQMREEAMNEGLQPHVITKNGIVVSGNDYMTVRQGKTSGQMTSAQKAKIAREMQDQQDQQYKAMEAVFKEQERQKRLARARENLRKKREKAIREREEDNRRAETAYANMNAQLEVQTHQNIQNDHWHATQGRDMARQVAREQVGQPKGMVITSIGKPKKNSGVHMAERMRGNEYVVRARKPKEGGMRYYSQRPMPPVVRQKPNPSGQYIFTGRATKTSIFIQKDDRFIFNGQTSGPSLAKDGVMFVLSPNATVTTGQDYHSIDFEKRKEEIPPPATRISKPLTRDQIIDEILSTD